MSSCWNHLQLQLKKWINNIGNHTKPAKQPTKNARWAAVEIIFNYNSKSESTTSETTQNQPNNQPKMHDEQLLKSSSTTTQKANQQRKKPHKTSQWVKTHRLQPINKINQSIDELIIHPNVQHIVQSDGTTILLAALGFLRCRIPMEFSIQPCLEVLNVTSLLAPTVPTVTVQSLFASGAFLSVRQTVSVISGAPCLPFHAGAGVAVFWHWHGAWVVPLVFRSRILGCLLVGAFPLASSGSVVTQQ